jgi:hypothetical protein
MKIQHTESCHILLVQNHGKGLAVLLPLNEQKEKHIVQKHLLGRYEICTTDLGFVTSDMWMVKNVLGLEHIQNSAALSP